MLWIAQKVPRHTLDSWIGTHSYCHCDNHSTTVKARACQVAHVLSPSRGLATRIHFPSAGVSADPPAAPQLGTPERSALLCEQEEGRGRLAVTAGSQSPEQLQRTVSHLVAFLQRVPTAASLLVCRCLLLHFLTPLLPPLQRQSPFSHCFASCLSMCSALNTWFNSTEAKGHWALDEIPSGRWTGTYSPGKAK